MERSCGESYLKIWCCYHGTSPNFAHLAENELKLFSLLGHVRLELLSKTDWSLNNEIHTAPLLLLSYICSKKQSLWQLFISWTCSVVLCIMFVFHFSSILIWIYNWSSLVLKRYDLLTISGWLLIFFFSHIRLEC